MGVIDVTGHKFGRLNVLEYVGTNETHYAMFRCKCDCGNEVVVKGRNLRTGHTQSCGCYCKDRTREAAIQYKTIHGQTDSRLYRVWNGMKKRCYNRNNKSYSDYGGRGIVVCDEWRNSYQAFCDWAINHGYKEDAEYMECTLDRIDNNKGYCPDNCRWVSNSYQAFNRRKRKNKSGARGIDVAVNGKFKATLTKNGVRHHLGTFATIKEAIAVRHEAEQYYFGMVLDS